MLRLEKLNARYGNSHAIHDVSMTVDDGEVVTVLGRNGAGKTTTANTILGLGVDSDGKVGVDNLDISNFPPHKRVRAGIAYVPQGGRLFMNLDVRENLETVRGRPSDSPFTVNDAFALFPRLAAFPDRMAGVLSGGERQMLAFGRALMANPTVLVMDEPGEGLAPNILDTIADTIRTLASERRIACLLLEQNPNFALATAHRVLFIEKGALKWEGPVSDEGLDGALQRYLGTSISQRERSRGVPDGERHARYE